jgi:two-component system chemotaxis response regulator CheY
MKKQVLLVDDNKAVRTMLSSLLTNAGYLVTEAADGLDGLTKAKNIGFDAFVVDYKMPIMDGITLLKGLKEMPQYCAHPMILLTTDDGSVFVNKVASLDSVSVMRKPIDQEQLLLLLSSAYEFDGALTA